MDKTPIPSVGELLRTWRQRRRLSQLDLGLDADVSPRHLSFVETGRSLPSREMLLRLSEHLDVPLRERNVLLVAAGYAPLYRERGLADPDLQAARTAVELVLNAHLPYPALAIDRHWTLVAANAAVAPLLEGLAPALVAPPVNVLRLTLHPDGLAPRVVNLAQWREHLFGRLRRQIDNSGDPETVALLDELRGYPAPAGEAPSASPPMPWSGIAVPFRLATPAGVLSFITTVTVFGTPSDITLSELAIEALFPADEATARVLRGAA
jgi:transcriptional regulator with XRE-family HTH domain